MISQGTNFPDVNHKYLYQGYSWDIFISFSHEPLLRSPALGAFRLLRTRVATAFFAAPLTTAMRRSSVAATDRPLSRVLPSPNCHSHWFTS